MEIQPPVRIFLFFWFDNSHWTHDFCWDISSEYFLCKCSDFTLHSKAYSKPLVYCYSAKFLWGLQYHQIFPDLSINERGKWIGACYFSYLVVPFSGKKENMSYFLKENYQDIKEMHTKIKRRKFLLPYLRIDPPYCVIVFVEINHWVDKICKIIARTNR